MLNFSKTKVLFIYLTFLLISIFCISNFLKSENLFFKKKINLGLDLQGGSYLLLEVDTSSLEKKRLQSKVIPIKKMMNEKSISFSDFIINNKNISFRLKEKDISKFEKSFINQKQNDINIYLDEYNSFELEHEVVNQKVNVYLSKYGIIKLRTAAVNQSIEIVRRRIDEIGTKEPSIIKRGNNRILVELPGIKDPERIKELLGKTAELSFRLVTNDTGEFGVEKYTIKDTLEKISVSKRIILSGENLVDAQPKYDNLNNEPIVAFSLDRLGSQRFGKVTSQNIGKRLVIILDNEAISAPVIRDAITGGNGTISGNFTFQSATDLALLLRSGALPTPLSVVEERTVGPDLGKDSIEAGVISLIFGFCLVIIFMFIKYKSFGFIANISLISNLLMLVGILTLLEATLTLPGIAGIILTVGMAVDANVLIFERIKEELNNENSNIAAFDLGFKRSIVTILDANITTLIASIILFVFGSGPIKGFAVTLSIGLITTLFSAYFISRHLTSIIVFRNRDKKLLI
ncbi:MAG: protein translocase subunit SecD [Candidatus Pelagibacter sp.]|nr:protein translocase subunit SecD [Candidatus Pelagibacter sp.]